MIFYIILIVLLGLDQITKALIHSKFLEGDTFPIIRDFFHLTYVENHGVIFGLFEGKISIFTVISIILILYVIFTEFKNFKNYTKWTKIGISIIAAGAAGNMIDRIFRGFVIDMIDFNGIWVFVFNLADMYVHIGIYIIVIDYAVRKYRKKELKIK